MPRDTIRRSRAMGWVQMLEQLLPLVGGVLDTLANKEEGQKLIDDLASVIGRLYRNLTESQHIPPDAAAVICVAIGKVKSS